MYLTGSSSPQEVSFQCATDMGIFPEGSVLGNKTSDILLKVKIKLTQNVMQINKIKSS